MFLLFLFYFTVFFYFVLLSFPCLTRSLRLYALPTASLNPPSHIPLFFALPTRVYCRVSLCLVSLPSRTESFQQSILYSITLGLPFPLLSLTHSRCLPLVSIPTESLIHLTFHYSRSSLSQPSVCHSTSIPSLPPWLLNPSRWSPSTRGYRETGYRGGALSPAYGTCRRRPRTTEPSTAGPPTWWEIKKSRVSSTWNPPVSRDCVFCSFVCFCASLWCYLVCLLLVHAHWINFTGVVRKALLEVFLGLNMAHVDTFYILQVFVMIKGEASFSHSFTEISSLCEIWIKFALYKVWWDVA